METKKCCMVACENVEIEQDGGKKGFYVFPTDFNLCMLWVQNSGRPEFFEDFAFAGAAPFLNRHICSDHFKNTDLLDPNDPNSGLLPQAVPNLNFIVFKTEVKEEPLDTGYDDSLAKTLISDPELISEIKLEKLENDNCDELNTNFSFSSNDESCNDLLRVKLDGGIEVYKETEEDKQLSNEFFRKYENAVTCRWRTKTQHHPDGDKATRLQKDALRARIRRSQETEEQKRIRKMKNALRAAFRRQNESPEQRTLRKMKDMLRAQRRRKAESDAEAKVRRYNDAVRAAYRRNNETEEQRLERRMKDVERAAKRRSMETPEQRENRLRKDRERASRRRVLKKITEQMRQLNAVMIPQLDSSENGALPMIVSLNSIVGQCNDNTAMDRLQQVLQFVETQTRNQSSSDGQTTSNQDKSQENHLMTLKSFSETENDGNDRVQIKMEQTEVGNIKTSRHQGEPLVEEGNSSNEPLRYLNLGPRSSVSRKNTLIDVNRVSAYENCVNTINEVYAAKCVNLNERNESFGANNVDILNEERRCSNNDACVVGETDIVGNGECLQLGQCAKESSHQAFSVRNDLGCGETNSVQCTSGDPVMESDDCNLLESGLFNNV